MSASIAALVAQLAELTEVLRPVAARLAADVEISPAGRDSESSPEGPAVAATGQPGDQPVDERAEQIAGLRELADYLEAHPDLPLGPYDVEMQIHVTNLPHMRDKDEPAKLAELTRIGEVLGVDADLRDEPGSMHPHVAKTFRGGARYQAVHVTEAYKRGYKPAPIDIPRGGEEVAGPVEGTGPATPPEAVHEQVAAWGGVPGSSGVECACGVTYDGFDTIAEAEALRARHADRDDEGSATAPEPDPCPKGDPGCETGDDGSCHDACEPATAPGDDDEGPVAGCECEDCEDLLVDAMDEG